MIKIRRKFISASICLTAALGIAAANLANASPGRYQSQSEFINELFPAAEPVADAIWLDDKLRRAATEILGHSPARLRFRYWHGGDRTAWVLDEIGKEKPITVGIGIENERIITVRVLEFRESRGWEVRYPFFVQQFEDATLANDLVLTKNIDNITGATLSVNAVRKIAALALYLHEHRSR